MDPAAGADMERAEALVAGELAGTGVTYHALRLRNLGDAVALDLHLVFDDATSIRDAHAFATKLERRLAAAFPPKANVMTHLEPRRDHERLHGSPGAEPG